MVYKEPHIAGGSKGILYPYEKYNKKECFLEKYVLLQPQNLYSLSIIRKSKFPQNPKRSVRFSGKRTKRSVQKRKARNTQKAETKVL